MPEPRVTMPNFLVIGANRAGTTSLYQYLKEHPDVFMSPTKEPSYFAPSAHQPDAPFPVTSTLEEYLRLFDGVNGEHAIGEASTAYLSGPDTPRLIRDAVPDARLVAVLRNPADRAFSAHATRVGFGEEDLPFAEAIVEELGQDPNQARKRRYVKGGFYGRYLTRYLECFARDRVKVYLFEDLVAEPRVVMRDLFEYLEVDPLFVPRTDNRHNAARYPPKHKAVDRLLGWRAAKALARRVVPRDAWRRASDYARRKNAAVPDFPVELRQHLIEIYRDDIAVVQQITQRDLSAWLM